MVYIAHTLGRTAHLSPLLRKARHLGFVDGEALLHLAAARGCHHYTPVDPYPTPVQDPGDKQLSDAELAIAMISAAQKNDPRLIRCAAQLISGPHINARNLVRLARMERCEALLLYIARHAHEWDTNHTEFWSDILAMLPQTATTPPGLWPHPSRFLIQAGYKRGGGSPPAVWLRPKPRKE